MSEQQPTSNKKKKWNTRGFYIALSVCMVAVGAAAWTTYDSITSNINHADTGNQTSQTASAAPGEKQVGQTVSGILTSSSTPAKESAPSSSKEEKPSSSSSSSKSTSSAIKDKPKAEGAVSSSSKSAALTVTEPTSFTYPLGKEITKAYSGENLVYSETMQDWRAHQGTDFKASKGEAVHAIADGTVKKIYDDTLLGHVVVIAHGSMEASYCGLNDAAPVRVNDAVKEGQEIGTVGTVPMEVNEEIHLHLEIMKNGKWMDPVSIFKESK